MFEKLGGNLVKIGGIPLSKARGEQLSLPKNNEQPFLVFHVGILTAKNTLNLANNN